MTSESSQKPMQTVPAIGLASIARIVVIFAAGLIVVGLLRYCHLICDSPPAVTGYATAMYVGLTIFAAIALTRAGVPFKRLGFGLRFRPLLFFALALLGVALLQLAGWLLSPVWEHIFGSGRNLERFSDVTGSRDSTDWTTGAQLDGRRLW